MLAVFKGLMTPARILHFDNSYCRARHCAVEYFDTASKKQSDAATQAEDEVERRLFLNIVVRECATIFKLFATKD